jgi:hypothetical protein
MVELRINQQQQEQTPREKAKAARLRLIAENYSAPSIQVWAATEELRSVLRHPSGTKFRGDLSTPADWPHDSFTHRRIRDGSVVTGGPASPRQPDDTSKLSVRERAAARRPKLEDVPPVRPLSAVPQEERERAQQQQQAVAPAASPAT